MSYAIGHIVYGIDLQPPSRWSGREDEYAALREQIEDLSEEELVSTRYSGNGEQPVFFGVDLGSIDEIKTIQASGLIELLTVKPEHEREYAGRLAQLASAAPELHERLAAMQPSVFITWGSS